MDHCVSTRVNERNPGMLNHSCDRLRVALANAEYRQIRRLTCEVDSRFAAIVVVGQVPTYFLKQQAQELVRRSLGLMQFVNRIEVVTNLG